MTSGIPFVGQSGKENLPFMVQGTTSSPVFVPDMGGIVSSGLSNSFQRPKQPSQEGLGEMMGKLLGKKK